MTDQPISYPGGYTSGLAAVRDLVRLTRLLGAAQDSHARLTAALRDIDRMMTGTDRARQDALRAIERFAEEQPSSLGVTAWEPLESGLAEVEGNLSALERDVQAVLRAAAERGL